MIKVILRLDCGIGTDTAEAYLVSEEEWEEYENGGVIGSLAQFAWEAAVEHAESYGTYPESYRPEDQDEDEPGDEYSDDINGWFELYNPDEHDCLRVGGGGWKFKAL